ncbi:Uncharacterised protein [Legionella steigerwaltii]|uniref:Uncharacterized protein n=1 Tax=Legionella steigerwaltii TaxID=460 RepID=A0A378LCF7_9GAMM|nr:hypothetical protein [Legionella steigerwaltii]KTD69896.1 hypothetical protein Lstg_3337 [Legionella steigerwaltii]STY21791.1 Uncharacterised protein [Legionella steigerwaltii]
MTASLLETFGIKKQLETPVPQLGITSDLYTRQLESQQYFTIEKDAKAADGNKLAIHIQDEQNFRIATRNHIEFLNKCTALFKEKSTQLKSIDQKIAGSVAFGVAATALSFLPVVGFLGWIGWAATAYFINQRATAYAEYHESLTLLVGVCNWCLGEGPDKRKNSIPNLTKNEAIRNMMAALYPVLTKDQVNHLIADDIEKEFGKELEAYESRFQLGFFSKQNAKQDDTIALSKKGAEFSRCIYGFNRGGFTDYLQAIVSILPDLYKAALHGAQRLKYWWQEKSNTPEKEDESHTSKPTAML